MWHRDELPSAGKFHLRQETHDQHHNGAGLQGECFLPKTERKSNVYTLYLHLEVH